MSVVDDILALSPQHYEVVRVAFQVTTQGLRAFWDVKILNGSGRELKMVHPVTQPDVALRQALIDWYLDSVVQFEAATGLTEWEEPV